MLPGKLMYAVYKFKNGEKIDLKQSKNIIALTSQQSFIDKNSTSGYTYIVTSLDRCWNESAASNLIEL
jgi:hypothetical protein